uniref:Uncharacterized protein n=1 Tax=Parascaris equorum TaxID=6256 RepID=A0A914S615_PAREQ
MSTMSVSVHNCPQASSGQASARYSRVGASRQMSNDMVEDEGCCLAKIFLTNIVSFATSLQSYFLVYRRLLVLIFVCHLVLVFV